MPAINENVTDERGPVFASGAVPLLLPTAMTVTDSDAEGLAEDDDGAAEDDDAGAVDVEVAAAGVSVSMTARSLLVRPTVRFSGDGGSKLAV